VLFAFNQVPYLYVLFAFQFIWLFSIITLGPVTYGEKSYPDWAVQFGWALGSISIIPIPVFMVYQMLMEEGSFMEVTATFTLCKKYSLVHAITKHSFPKQVNSKTILAITGDQ